MSEPTKGDTKPLELDVLQEKSEQHTMLGTVKFEELRFNYSLIIKYRITVKRTRKTMVFWFDAEHKEQAFAFYDALFSEVPAPTFVFGPEYREI